MAYVSGYDYDVFVSYAHVDNEPFLAGGKGWVTSLVEGLRKLMAVKLGRTDSFSLWMDYALRYAEPVTPQLLNTVRKSAVLIVILSPGYLASDWCRRERDAFLGIVQARGARRVFVVERDDVDDADRPPELFDLVPFRFWIRDREGKAPHILGFPQPSANDHEYINRLHDLSVEITEELKRMNAAADSPQPIAGLADHTTPVFDLPKATVFLAQVTDDLDLDRAAVKRYLDQHNIEVVPATWYSQEPGAFRRSAEPDLAKADLFVQLLSGTAGKRPADLPQGYPCFQWELAKAANKPILQWRDKSIDLASIEDAEHRAFLQCDSVRAEPIEDFKREICRRLLEKPTRPPANDTHAFVFVDIESADRPIAEEVCAVLDRFGVEYALPLHSADPAENRRDLEENLASCDALIIIYGQTTATWVRRQLHECRKTLARRRPLPALALFEGPPAAKDPLDMKLQNMVVLNCRQGLDADKLQTFLSRVCVQAR